MFKCLIVENFQFLAEGLKKKKKKSRNQIFLLFGHDENVLDTNGKYHKDKRVVCM